MICKDCINKDHTTCAQRNANKQGADCDCLHRVKEKAKPDGE